jgi:hypothetical protein
MAGIHALEADLLGQGDHGRARGVEDFQVLIQQLYYCRDIDGRALSMVEGVRESLGYCFNLLDTHGLSSFGTGVDEENGFRSSLSIGHMPSASVTNGLISKPRVSGNGQKFPVFKKSNAPGFDLSHD